MRDVLEDQVCSPETFLLWVTVSTSNLHLRCSQTVSSRCLWKMKFAYCRQFSFYEDSGLPSDGLRQFCGRCMFLRFWRFTYIYLFIAAHLAHFFFFSSTFFFFFFNSGDDFFPFNKKKKNYTEWLTLFLFELVCPSPLELSRRLFNFRCWLRLVESLSVRKTIGNSFCGLGQI